MFKLIKTLLIVTAIIPTCFSSSDTKKNYKGMIDDLKRLSGYQIKIHDEENTKLINFPMLYNEKENAHIVDKHFYYDESDNNLFKAVPFDQKLGKYCAQGLEQEGLILYNLARLKSINFTKCNFQYVYDSMEEDIRNGEIEAKLAMALMQVYMMSCKIETYKYGEDYKNYIQIYYIKEDYNKIKTLDSKEHVVSVFALYKEGGVQYDMPTIYPVTDTQLNFALKGVERISHNFDENRILSNGVNITDKMYSIIQELKNDLNGDNILFNFRKMLKKTI